ncbi:conserved hypothetical protein [Symbiobacterium thermophilum IAM 14863]|uniref:GerMN domain-containing protein n=3 Tax=Symbiobacterium thermophilum TaxID=2734 RepID=Q67MV3_SYMTH|nr:conserved hypothetical protein [Symbiobacterium thermophilum IAM 14863]
MEMNPRKEQMSMSKAGPKAFARALPLMLAVLLAASGCAGVRPQPSPEGEAPVSPSVQVDPPVQTTTVTVFYPDWQVQHLIPEQRQVPEGSAAELATRVVEELLAGPADPHLKPAFPEGTRLLEPVKLEGGQATVNFSGELDQVQGSAAVMAALHSLRLSLGDIPGIDEVRIQVSGGSGGELDGMVVETKSPYLYLYPVFPNPERTRYLQSRADQGLDTWRLDPAAVARFEGRMFGFTAAELQQATVRQDGGRAEAYVTRDGTTYQFTLVRNPAAGEKGVWTIDSLNPMQWHEYDAVPAAVRELADRYAATTIGAAVAHSDRLYLIASVEEGEVRITSAEADGDALVVRVAEDGGQRLSIASVPLPGAAPDVVFRWEAEPTGPVAQHTPAEELPRLYTAEGVGHPEVKLTGDAVIASAVSEPGRIAVKGYARHLFEATVVARMLDGQGQEVAVAHATAAAAMWNWGEFTIVLEHHAPPGEYRVEVGDYSMRDGVWQPRAVTYVTVR